LIGTLYAMGEQTPGEQKPDRPKAGLLWARPTRRPKHTREQIAAAALAIADAEGIEAVTMRRIATEVGAGTMTIYHYVPSKSDLIALMLDAVMAEQLAAENDVPEHDWRAALTAIAHQARAMFRRHPWALVGMAELGSGGAGGAAGPNALRHFEQTLAAVASTGLPPAERMELIAAVDDYVAGFVLKSDREPGLDAVPDDMVGPANEYLDGLIGTGDYPYVAELLGCDPDRFGALRRIASAYSADERFALGLRRLLDGVQAQIDRHLG
jgi:AcrR family transcriptional regulator